METDVMRLPTLIVGVATLCLTFGCSGHRLSDGYARPHQDPSGRYIVAADGAPSRPQIQAVEHWAVPAFGKDGATAHFIVLPGERSFPEELIRDDRPERRLDGLRGLPDLNEAAFVPSERRVVNENRIVTLAPECWLVGLDPLVFAYSDDRPREPGEGRSHVRLISPHDFEEPIRAVAEFTKDVRTDADWKELRADPERYRTLFWCDQPLSLAALLEKYAGQGEVQLRNFIADD